MSHDAQVALTIALAASALLFFVGLLLTESFHDGTWRRIDEKREKEKRAAA